MTSHCTSSFSIFIACIEKLKCTSFPKSKIRHTDSNITVDSREYKPLHIFNFHKFCTQFDVHIGGLNQLYYYNNADIEGIDRTCGAGTLLDKSLIRSLAFMIIYGSLVFRVVETVIDPAIWTQQKSHKPINKSSLLPGNKATNPIKFQQLNKYNKLNTSHTKLTKSSSQPTPCSFNADFTVGQTSCRYFSAQIIIWES